MRGDFASSSEILFIGTEWHSKIWHMYVDARREKSAPPVLVEVFAARRSVVAFLVGRRVHVQLLSLGALPSYVPISQAPRPQRRQSSAMKSSLTAEVAVASNPYTAYESLKGLTLPSECPLLRMSASSTAQHTRWWRRQQRPISGMVPILLLVL